MSRTRRVLQDGRARVGIWLPLLLLLLLGMMVTGVMAQEDEGVDSAGLFSQERDDTYPVENLNAANDEVFLTVTRDAYVSSNNPNFNYGFVDPLNFGTTQGGLGVTRPLFYFDMRSIPSGAVIEKAEFRIYLASNNDSDSSRGYAANHLAGSWSEGSVTWNNMPAWGSEAGRGTLSNSPGWHSTDITGLAREWLRNPGGNNGIILVGDERPGLNFQRSYFSKETLTGNRPQLYVKFSTTVDDRAPIVDTVQPSEGAWSPAHFKVKWEGHDPTNSDGSPGSGIRWYDVFYTLNGGSKWIVGRAQVTETETEAGPVGHLAQIGIYSRARDNAGNEGPWPSGSSSIQTWTRVDAEAPQATVNPLPEFTVNSTFQVSWQDTKEFQESGIRYYDVQFRFDGGEWFAFVYDTTATSTMFENAQQGLFYEFRARAVDNVGNVQDWGEAQAGTVVWTDPVGFMIPFPVPAIYQKLNGPEVGDGFTVSWDGLTAPGTTIVSFDVQVRRPNSNTFVLWQNQTTQKSAKFELGVNDPDGLYVFQARARNDQGVTGPYFAEVQASMMVDRNAPFIEPQAYLPVVMSN